MLRAELLEDRRLLAADASLDAISLPELAIHDVTVDEGNSGTTSLTFQVDIVGAPSRPVSVDYHTADGTATLEDGDYRAASGTLTWNVGDTSSRFIIATVLGDDQIENDEVFNVQLTSPLNAVLGMATGVATIVDDDTPNIAQGIGSYSDAEFGFVELNPANPAQEVYGETGQYVEFQGKIYFSGFDRTTVDYSGVDNFGYLSPDPTALWVVDPQTQAYSLVAELPQRGVGGMIVLGDTIFFEQYAGNNKHRLYSWKGPGHVPVALALSTGRMKVAAIGERVFFSANVSSTIGSEPWVTDGTISGTQLLRDINPGPSSSNPFEFIDLGNGKALFSAKPSNSGWRVFVSDGTKSGTIELSAFPSRVSLVGSLEGETYVRLIGTDQIWRTDGSAAGTALVSNNLRVQESFVFNDRLYISAAVPTSNNQDDYELWAFDGTAFEVFASIDGTKPQGSLNVPAGLSPHGFMQIDESRFLFAGYTTNTASQRGIWVSDGTQEGTSVLLEESNAPPSLLVHGNAFFQDWSNNRYGIMDTDTGEIRFVESNAFGSREYLGVRGAIFETGKQFFASQYSLAAIDVLSHPPAKLVTKPQATLPENVQLTEGQELRLNVFDSIALEPGLQAFDWDFDYDGISFQVDESGPQVAVPGTENGPRNFVVALRISDVWGQSSIATTIVSVENSPPVIEGVHDTSTPLGQEFTLQAEISDPGSTDTFSVVWNLGDGTTVNDVYSISHTYAAKGEYFASLTVTDSDGDATVQNFRVVVGPPVLVMTSEVQLEEGQVLTLTASVEAALSEDVIVPIAYSGTAIDEVDFAATVYGGAAPTQIVIPAGATSSSIEIVHLQNALDEDVKTIVINLTVPSNASLVSHEPISINLLDDDAQPTVFISSTPQVIAEADVVLPLTVSLSEVSGRDVILSLSTGGTALLDVDYRLGDAILVIPAGEMSVSTTLTIIDDTLGESAEQIALSIEGAQNAVLSSLPATPSKIMHVISANDEPTVQFLTVLERVSEAAGTHAIIATLSNQSDTPITVNYSLSGSAVLGQDYSGVAPSGTVTFPPFTTTQSIALTLINDTYIESTEAIVASLQNPSGASLGPTTLHSTQIIDDESLRVTLVTSARSLWEDEWSFTVVANLNSPAPSGGFSIPLSFGGTAIEGTHYFAEPNAFEFSGGETSKTLTFVLASDDSEYEPNRSISITAAKPAEATLANDKLAVTLLDNEVYVSLVQVSNNRFVSSTRTTVDEGDAAAAFTVYLDRPTNRNVTVNFQTQGITAERSDYSSPTPTLTIPAGGGKATGSVGITNDGILEDTETVRVSISSATNALLHPNQAARRFEIAIRDNDTPPSPYWTLPSTIVREADTPIVVVKASLARAAETTVHATFTVAGSATQNEDYFINGLSTNRGSVRFDPGEREKYLTIAIVDDAHYEDLETIELYLDTGSGQPASFTVYLNDNDAKPREPAKRQWYQKWGDELADAGRSINRSVNEFGDLFVDLFVDPYKDGVSDTLKQLLAVNTSNVDELNFLRNWRYTITSQLFDGYLDDATVFVDYNFNESLDFVDSNGDGIANEGELVETIAETGYDGQFQTSIPIDADRNWDGRFSLDEGQLVAFGGTDVSLGAESFIPMTAPLTYPTISPLSTLVAKLRLETGDSLAGVESRVATGLSLTSPGYLRSDLISLAGQGDSLATDAFATSVQVHSTVQQIASFIAGTAAGPSVRLAGSVAFADIASKLAAETAVIDLAEPVVIKSVMLGTLNRLGVPTIASELLDAAAEVIAAGNQSIASTTGTGRARLESIVQAQSVASGGASEALHALAGGALSASAIVSEFTGANLESKTQTAVIGNVIAPYVVADDVVISEGDSGTKLAIFNVGITAASNLPITVDFSTADFSAIAGEDYQAVSGQLTWAPGETTVYQIQVPILGDTLPEADERFHFLLTNAVNAELLETVSYGDIISDDAVDFVASDSSVDHNLVLNVDSDRIRLFDNGSVAFEGAFAGGQEFVVNSVDGVRSDLTVAIQPDSATPSDGVRFVGNGLSSSLTIDASHAASIDHIQYSDGNGRFVIDGAILRYENVGSINSPASAFLTGIPAAEIGYGESISLSGIPSSQFDESEATSETWTVYRDNVLVATHTSAELLFTADEVGDYRLTYTASQEGRLLSLASYEFTVSHAPPVAEDDYGSTDEDTSLILEPLSNDVSAIELTVVATSDPAHGSVTVLPNGVLRYTPHENFNGQDSFEYTLADASGNEDTATVFITVMSVNDAPRIDGGPDSAQLDETNGTLRISGSFAVSDVDATDTVTASVAQLIVSGSSDRLDPAAPTEAELLAMLTVSPTTILGESENSSTLAWDFSSGSQHFDYLASGETLILTYTVQVTDDGETPLSDSELVTITITGSNDAPLIHNINSSNDSLINTGNIGVPVRIDGEFVDVDTSDTHIVTIDWGDTQTDTFSVDGTEQTEHEVFDRMHSYAAGGIYTVAVTVDDSRGGRTTATATVVIAGVGVVDGTLYVIGTEGEDKVDVKLKGGKGKSDQVLRVKGEFDKKGSKDKFDMEYPESAINQITILLRGGDDDAEIDKDITIDALLDGGDGDDKLTGGSGNDILLGGAGDDKLKGQDGDDLLDGGDGDDKLDGGKGADILLGGAGDDKLDGGSGSDSNELLGDVLSGGDGDDQLKGGKGMNVLIGGQGIDKIQGGKAGNLFVGGWTVHDSDVEKLLLIRDIWTSGTSPANVVTSLTGSGGLLEAGKIYGDGKRDKLDGDKKSFDLFFAELGVDHLHGEIEDDEFVWI